MFIFQVYLFGPLTVSPFQTGSQNQPTQQAQPKVKKAREEMWWVIIAKSKTLRFFAVSCEFILFLGGLWITFTVNNPASKTWLNGNVNMIFLTIMGWAIDAAMPEAWLHVVIQHVEKKAGQLGWSKFVAIGISFLFIGNIVYSILTSGDTTDRLSGVPGDAAGWVLLVLTILRIAIGFVYITVRQCQEWIDRQEDKQQPAQTPPALPDVEELIQQAVNTLQVDMTKQLTELAGKQSQSLDLFRMEQQRLLGKVQDIENSVPALDYEAIVSSVTAQLEVSLETRFQTLLGQRVSVTPTSDTPLLGTPERAKQQRQNNIVQIPRTSVTRRPVKHETAQGDTGYQVAITRLLDQNKDYGVRELGRLVGCSPTTAGRLRERYMRELAQSVEAGDGTPDETEEINLEDIS